MSIAFTYIFDRYEKGIMKYDYGISNGNILLLTFVIMDGKNQFKRKRGNLSDGLNRNNNPTPFIVLNMNNSRALHDLIHSKQYHQNSGGLYAILISPIILPMMQSDVQALFTWRVCRKPKQGS